MRNEVPAWLLERLAQGELPEERAAAIRARLGEAETEARVEELRAADSAFLERFPPRPMGAAIRARLEEKSVRSHRRPLRLAAFASLGAAALVALFVGVLPEPAPEIRAKGLAPAILVHRSQGGAIEKLSDGARARAGDLVQLSYLAAGKRYGVILSIDGSGVVSLHHPLEGGWAAPLSSEGAVALPHAYELDAAPAFERFFFLAADEPFPVREVLEAAKRAAPDARRLEVDAGIVQASFLLRKP